MTPLSGIDMGLFLDAQSAAIGLISITAGRERSRRSAAYTCGAGCPDMLRNLHLLRAVAALAVVYFHTTSEAGLHLSVNIGSHGVDLFFVISGFIIAYIGA